MYPDCDRAIAKGLNVNCGTCRRWDRDKRECKDKVLHFAEWDKEHGRAERMMHSNRGVRLG